MSNSFDPGETPRYSALGVSSGSKLVAYGTIVVLGGLRVNLIYVIIYVENKSPDPDQTV